MNITRRFFLKGGLIVGGAALMGIRFTGAAIAKVKALKEYMQDRIDSVYKADATFKPRASQDNIQVQALYKNYLGEPGGNVSHQYLHMHFTDRSHHLKALQASGKYSPNPRMEEFQGNSYPYEA